MVFTVVCILASILVCFWSLPSCFMTFETFISLSPSVLLTIGNFSVWIQNVFPSLYAYSKRVGAQCNEKFWINVWTKSCLAVLCLPVCLISVDFHSHLLWLYLWPNHPALITIVSFSNLIPFYLNLKWFYSFGEIFNSTPFPAFFCFFPVCDIWSLELPSPTLIMQFPLKVGK